MEEFRRLCRWEDNIKMDLKEIGVEVTMEMIWKNTGGFRWEDSIKMDLKEIDDEVTMEMIWKNTGGFVDGRTVLRWISKK